MTEILKEQLQALSENKLLMQAIRTVFNQSIEELKPLVGALDTDDMLGQKYRAYIKAKEILKQTIDNIESYKYHKKNNNSFDKAK